MNSLLHPVVVCLGFLPALVGAMDLSGKVLGVDRKPLGGIQVRLAGTGSVATTDAMGEWSIQSQTTGAGFAGMPQGRSPRAGLVVENGRLRLRIGGRDFAGRERDGFRVPIGSHRPAARSQGGPDSLIYSLGGRILLRDTVSASRSGIVRILDSTFNPSIVYGFLVDSRDGRIYRTVKIGRQMWMAENLTYRNGGGADSGRWLNGSPDSGAKYGRLYTWASSMGLSDSCDTKACARQVMARHRGLCPDGWHVPSLAEWDTLLRVAGIGIASGRGLKSVDGWVDSGGGVDAFGFRALPGGNVLRDSTIVAGRTGHWWSATEFQQEADAWQGYMTYNGTTANRMNLAKWRGSSLRCVQMDAPGYEGGNAPAGMKLIPAGSFTMGNPDAAGVQLEAEMPHRVTLSAFWMDSALVTQGQYRAVMGLEPSYYVNCGADCPVERVTWFDAILYCNARSKREGLELDTVYTYTSRTMASGNWVTALTGLAIDLSRSGYRLPTEAQWEYAARAGTETAYFWGADSSADSVRKYAWFEGTSGSGSAPHPVGSKSSNPWGLYDMGGNLRQWINDWYGPYPSEERIDPEGPTSGTFRVLRGGGQSGGMIRLRTAARDVQIPSTTLNEMGFRTVRPAR